MLVSVGVLDIKLHLCSSVVEQKVEMIARQEG
jgi:hypothetical protein